MINKVMTFIGQSDCSMHAKQFSYTSIVLQLSFTLDGT